MDPKMKSIIPCNLCKHCISRKDLQRIYIQDIPTKDCYGYCEKMGEYVTNKDGCTLGKIVMNFFVEEISEDKVYLS